MAETVICNCTVTLPEGKARDAFIKNMALYREIILNELSDMGEVWAQIQQASVQELQKKIVAESKVVDEVAVIAVVKG